MTRSSIPRWTRPRPLLTKAQIALSHPEMQPLPWLLERNYPDIVATRLAWWRSEATSEKGQEFWQTEFPKLLRKALSNQHSASALALWKAMPEGMPLPPNTLTQWIAALNDHEEFGKQWSTQEQQAWIAKLRSSTQNMTTKAWEELGKTAIHVLDQMSWANPSDAPVPSLAESLWKKGAGILERAKHLVTLRLAVDTIESRNTNRQAPRHIAWALEAQTSLTHRQALADHVVAHLMDHAHRYPAHRDPTWLIMGELAAQGCADTSAFAELFEAQLDQAHRSSRHDRVRQVLATANMPSRIQLTEAQAVRWITATRSYWGPQDQELKNALAAWQLLVKTQLVPMATQTAWMNALVEQVPDVQRRLEELLNTSPTPALMQLHQELRAHHLFRHLPTQEPPQGRPGFKPRF